MIRRRGRKADRDPSVRASACSYLYFLIRVEVGTGVKILNSKEAVQRLYTFDVKGSYLWGPLLYSRTLDLKHQVRIIF